MLFSLILFFGIALMSAMIALGSPIEYLRREYGERNLIDILIEESENPSTLLSKIIVLVLLGISYILSMYIHAPRLILIPFRNNLGIRILAFIAIAAVVISALIEVSSFLVFYLKKKEVEIEDGEGCRYKGTVVSMNENVIELSSRGKMKRRLLFPTVAIISPGPGESLKVGKVVYMIGGGNPVKKFVLQTCRWVTIGYLWYFFLLFIHL